MIADDPEVVGVQTTIRDNECDALEVWADVLGTSRAGALRVCIRYALENPELVRRWLDEAEAVARKEAQELAASWS